jgi:hypothetical protein
VTRFRCILFDWGGTLMSEDGGLEGIPLGLWPVVGAIDGARETLAALAPRHRLAVATNATVSRRDMIECALARVSLLQPRKYGVFSVWFNEGRRSPSDAQGLPTSYRLPDLIPLVTNEA